MTPNLVIFGEMLWDMLPSGKQPGGAPMNVAIHLKNFGADPFFISRVGSDDLGEELMDYLGKKDLKTDFIQTGNTHLTGIVKVNLTDKTEVTYKIVQPVAWDYIQFTNENKQLVSEADVFIYGSLAARSPQSREALMQLLEVAKLKVFDVNIRPPHYDRPTVEHLMAHADIVKLNENEIALLADWYNLESDLETQIKYLTDRNELKMVIVTLGAEGAMVFSNSKYYYQSGFDIKVQDTIGSGDSFLAMFIQSYLNDISILKALEKACAVGALVATHKGATPFITEIEIANFLTNNQIKHV